MQGSVLRLNLCTKIVFKEDFGAVSNHTAKIYAPKQPFKIIEIIINPQKFLPSWFNPK